MAGEKPTKISVIVTTYNWPYALRAVLTALFAQKTRIPFEIIVADDGSREETALLIHSFSKRQSIPLLHIWQEDLGFRAATIRNKAAVRATGDYIIFLDGDCVPRENFIERYALLTETATFIAGNRLLLNRDFTLKVLSEDLPLHQWTFYQWCIARLRRSCNRLLPLLSLPLGPLRFLSSRRWQGAKGCNLGLWKKDLFTVNGWEEKFMGWGYEDSDLVIRLIQSGLKRKEGRYYLPVIHLWHPENDRSHERENWLLLKSREKSGKILAEKGLDQYELFRTEKKTSSLQECI
jgi:glycosyltransferase involved in cell wall biosynthesis